MQHIRESFRGVDDYRQLVAAELDQRRRRNPRYSLRALARDVQMSPSFLSEVLTGKYGMSRDHGALFAAAVGWSDVERAFFCDLIDARDGKTESTRQLAALRLKRYAADADVASLTLDVFRLVADWFHFAMVEALQVAEVEQTPKGLANALGIGADEANDALERLIRLGFLERRTDGTLVVIKERTFSGDVPSEVIRYSHAQLIEKAKEAVFEQTFHERELSSTILAFNSRELPRFRDALATFRRAVAELGRERPERRDHVYCLGVQFFKLSRSPTQTRPALDGKEICGDVTAARTPTSRLNRPAGTGSTACRLSV